MVDKFLSEMLTLDRWPFWSAVIVFTAIGLFTKYRLFTRERAYRDWGAEWKHNFWYWMRETLILHPLAAGFALGIAWIDPEGQEWPLIGSMMYFASAGAVSLVAWIFIVAIAKKRGITLTLPGNTIPPG